MAVEYYVRRKPSNKLVKRCETVEQANAFLLQQPKSEQAKLFIQFSPDALERYKQRAKAAGRSV